MLKSEKAKRAINISQIKGFLGRHETLQQAQADKFIAQFTRFAPQYRKVQKEAEILGRDFAPDFNIYRFLHYERQEDFHSRLISFLLNPRESHEQGHLFLEMFYKVLQKRYPEIPFPSDPINQGAWIIVREVESIHGRLDIIIRNPFMGALYVIENKVDAFEQPNQIKRYGKYLENQDKYPFKGLFFLTIDGRDAVSAGDIEYCPISYERDIRKWLEVALPTVKANNVKETVQQYLDLIKSLSVVGENHES